MIPIRRFRPFLAMLLAFCLVSASLWSVSADALADALSVEPGFSKVDSDVSRAPGNKHCNEGCHAQSRLTGLECSNSPFMPPAVEEAPWAEYLLDVPTRPHDDPFRPPRPTFQA